jgi:hypothetical protein
MTEQDPPRPSWAADGQLPAAVPGLVQTRTDLHRLAYAVLAVSRHGSTGRFGLRASRVASVPHCSTDGLCGSWVRNLLTTPSQASAAFR